MMKFYTFLTVVAMAFAASATSMAAPSEEPTAPDNDYKLVVIDYKGLEHTFDLYEDANGYYTTTLAFDYDPYYEFEWDYTKTDKENKESHPVPFYFYVNGERYGAESTTPASFDIKNGNPPTSYKNPLTADAEEYYTLPIGYAYELGVTIIDGKYYVYALNMVCPDCYDSVDELSNSKIVAGVHYYNLAGQEVKEASGATIVVTTYTDGSISTSKVMK